MIYLKRTVQLYRRRCFKRDLDNVISYGYDIAPRMFELIWVNPLLVEDAVTHLAKDCSARVIGGEWDVFKRRKLDGLSKIKMSKAHFVDGLSWQECGIFDHALRIIARSGHYDACSNINEVVSRYDKLDGLYSRLKDGASLLPQSKLRKGNLREKGGIIIHIGRSGELLFGGGGHHRLAIAQILKLNKIPAQLGVIHERAMSGDLMYGLRRAQHFHRHCNLIKPAIV
jgi:hypothetical protein